MAFILTTTGQNNISTKYVITNVKCFHKLSNITANYVTNIKTCYIKYYNQLNKLLLQLNISTNHIGYYNLLYLYLQIIRRNFPPGLHGWCGSHHPLCGLDSQRLGCWERHLQSHLQETDGLCHLRTGQVTSVL